MILFCLTRAILAATPTLYELCSLHNEELEECQVDSPFIRHLDKRGDHSCY